MIKVNIICVGRLKDAFFEEAAKEYIKMLGSFCQIKITEINAANLPQEPSRAEIEKALMAEAKEILRKIPERSKTIALSIEGKQLSSEEFADLLEGCKSSGAGEISFIIGGSYGLADDIKKRADFRLSFSKMTFPHRHFRVMLREQIYRAFSISAGGKYHK